MTGLKIFEILTQIVSVSAIIATTLPKPKEGSKVKVIYDLVQIIAFNFGKAKNK